MNFKLEWRKPEGRGPRGPTRSHAGASTGGLSRGRGDFTRHGAAASVGPGACVTELTNDAGTASGTGGPFKLPLAVCSRCPQAPQLRLTPRAWHTCRHVPDSDTYAPLADFGAASQGNLHSYVPVSIPVDCTKLERSSFVFSTASSSTL